MFGKAGMFYFSKINGLGLYIGNSLFIFLKPIFNKLGGPFWIKKTKSRGGGDIKKGFPKVSFPGIGFGFYLSYFGLGRGTKTNFYLKHKGLFGSPKNFLAWRKKIFVS